LNHVLIWVDNTWERPKGSDIDLKSFQYREVVIDKVFAMPKKGVTVPWSPTADRDQLAEKFIHSILNWIKEEALWQDKKLKDEVRVQNYKTQLKVGCG
jgi:hypothetical protein